MNRLIFKNMPKSTAIAELLDSRIEDLKQRFPRFFKHRSMRAEIEVENSLVQPGVDFYRVKLVLSLGKRGQLILQKKGQKAYEVLYEAFTRFEDLLQKKSKRNQFKQRMRALYEKGSGI